MEDVVEQLVGEIEDEFDVIPPDQPVLEGSNVLLLEGSTNIRDLESQHQVSLPRDAGFETLAGFMLANLQKIPQPGDSFDFEGRRFTVEDMDAHRIAKVRIENLAPAAMRQTGD